MTTNRRAALVVATVGLLAVVVAAPIVRAEPPAGTPAAAKAQKAKAPQVAVTVTGVVREGTGESGTGTFTLAAGGTTWTLSAGPRWYHGADNPLAAHVGKTVTISGTHREGSTELDVETVDGKAIRAAGKPPWAGGPWAVGSAHPGWKPWMADGKPGNGHGRENAPGQDKDKPADGD